MSVLRVTGNAGSPGWDSIAYVKYVDISTSIHSQEESEISYDFNRYV